MLQLLTLVAATAAVARAQSLTVANHCGESVLLFTQTSFGSIANYVNVGAGGSVNMGISSNWDGAINVGQWSTFRTSSPHINDAPRYGLHERCVLLYDWRSDLGWLDPFQQSRIQLCQSPNCFPPRLDGIADLDTLTVRDSRKCHLRYLPHLRLQRRYGDLLCRLGV